MQLVKTSWERYWLTLYVNSSLLPLNFTPLANSQHPPALITRTNTIPYVSKRFLHSSCIYGDELNANLLIIFATRIRGATGRYLKAYSVFLNVYNTWYIRPLSAVASLPPFPPYSTAAAAALRKQFLIYHVIYNNSSLCSLSSPLFFLNLLSFYQVYEYICDHISHTVYLQSLAYLFLNSKHFHLSSQD